MIKNNFTLNMSTIHAWSNAIGANHRQMQGFPFINLLK